MVYVYTDILGDALLKLPALPQLRESFPDAEITWCAGNGTTMYDTWLKPLVTPYIDTIRLKPLFGLSWLELFRPCPISDDYDIIIDTQHKLKATFQLKRISHKLFISPAANFLLSDKKPTNKKDYSGSLQNRISCLFKLAGANQLDATLKLNLPADYSQQAQSLLGDNDSYIGIAPGAGGLNKVWPLSRFVEVAKQQLANNRIPVFFIGPNEVDIYQELKRQVPEALFPEKENRSELKGPLLAMALAKKMRVALANDSGMGHVFSTANVPLVSLFGPSNSEKFVANIDNRTIIKAADYGSSEMQSIPVEPVLAAIDTLYG